METKKKKDRSAQHRHYTREDKNSTHNKAERHGAIRTRPPCLIQFTRANRDTGVFSQSTKFKKKGTQQFALSAVTDGVQVSQSVTLAFSCVNEKLVNTVLA